MRGRIAARRVCGVVLPALVALTFAASASAIALPAGFQATKLASGLTGTVSVGWAPDGRMFVASATGSGNIYIYNPGSTTPSATLQVHGNIYGIGVDTDFAQNGYVYIVRTFGGNTTQRLTRVTIKPDNTFANPATPETVLLGHVTTQPCGAPSNTNDCITASSPHDLNAVLSDPSDGSLWVANGDENNLGNPNTVVTYNEQSFAGKLIHVDRNGNGLPGHPFCPSDTNLTHVCTKIWAKGFKNPFRLTIGPDGLPLVGDVGWRSREEITRAQAGGDYGWPCYEGSIRTPGFADTPACVPEYAKEGTPDAALGPIYDYPHVSPGAAITAGPIYPGGAYPASFTGSMFFGDYVQQYIKLLHFGPGGSFQSVSDFATDAGPITDLELAPDGNLVIVTLGGDVSEIRFVGGANRSPTAVATADRNSGPAPLDVQFTGGGSSDPDGDALTYDWNFGDGSAHSTAANPTHTFAASAAARTVTLTVSDPHGATDSTSLTISPGNSAPVVTINAPASYRDGTTFTVTGSATDPEDGSIPVAALQWTSKFVHVDHTHDPENPSGVNHISITTRVDHDADSYYEVTLTATDSDGASTTKTVQIHPETRQLTLKSSPAGAAISYAGLTYAAPLVTQSAIGFITPISAAASFSQGGHNWVFDGWSDGGAREHTLTVPAVNTTLTANYHVDDGGGTGTGTIVEGETLKSPNTRARPFTDAQASGGKAEYFTSLVTATRTLTVPAGFDSITVRARGSQCKGAPNVEVSIDGGQVMSVPITSTTYADYTAQILARAAGSHTIAVKFPNDFAGGGCDRNVWVDRITLGGSGGSPPPPPPPPPGGNVVEAETMQGVVSGGNVAGFGSTTASGGRAARFYRNATITKTVTLPQSSQLTLRAGGTQCQGGPAATVAIDGKPVMAATASVRTFADYTASVPVSAGSHVVAVSFTNDFAAAGCDRNLEVDKLTFSP